LLVTQIKKAMIKEKGCFFCSLETEIERKYIETYLDELVMDSKAREELQKSRGFCNYHFYKMHAVANNPASEDAHAMALILKSVTERIIEDICNNSQIIKKSLKKFTKSNKYLEIIKRNKNTSLSKKLQRIDLANISCPTCNYIRHAILRYIEEFVQKLAFNEELALLFEKSQGLCLPHYELAVKAALTNTERK